MTDDPLISATLDRATDSITAPGRAAAVLREARRRRARRRGAAAAAVSSLVVAAVFGAGQLAGSGPMTGPSPTPPAASTEEPPVDPAAGWDPRTVDALPAAPNGDMALPDRVVPPDQAPPLVEDPVSAVVMAVVDGREAMLLSVDGEWRSLDLPGPYPSVVLSPEGTRLLTWRYARSAGETEEVFDVSTGERMSVPYPDEFEPWDFADWQWVDEDTLLLPERTGGWRVEVSSGSAVRTPYPAGGGNNEWTVDDEGAVLDSTGIGGQDVVNDWSSGGVRGVASGFEQFARLSAGVDTWAGTSYDGDRFSVVALDRDTLSERARLQIRDPGGFYTDYGLGTLAVTDGGSVLLRAISPQRRDLGFRLVRWDPTTDDLSVVTTVELGTVGRRGAEPFETFAADLLRESTS